MAPRLLYLINSLQEGGAERGLVELVRGGAFAGFEIRIAVLAEGSGAQRQAMTELGAPPLNLSGEARLTVGALIKAFGALRRLLEDWRPDAMLLSLPQANLVGRIASIGRPMLVCSFEHNTRLAREVYEWGYRLTSGRVDWLLADAPNTAAEAERRLYWRKPQERWVLPLASFGAAPPPPPSDRKGPFRIVAAGRLTRAKNHGVLIEAVSSLIASGRRATLTVYGEGPERAALEALIAKSRLDDAIRLPGFNPEWASAPADLFVLPSLYEGASLATLEAMHAGIPVLATATGGLVDYGAAIAEIDLAGLTAASLSRAIAALMDDPQRRRTLQSAGQALVRERFSRETVRAQYRKFNAALRARLGS